MVYYIVKLVVSAGSIVLISEIGKKSSLLGGLLASIPLTSFLAILWMYGEHKNVTPIIALSKDIFWLVIPSLVFFLLFPILLKRGVNFYLSMTIATAIMVGCYSLMIFAMKKM